MKVFDERDIENLEDEKEEKIVVSEKQLSLDDMLKTLMIFRKQRAKKRLKALKIPKWTSAKE